MKHISIYDGDCVIVTNKEWYVSPAIDDYFCKNLKAVETFFYGVDKILTGKYPDAEFVWIKDGDKVVQFEWYSNY